MVLKSLHVEQPCLLLSTIVRTCTSNKCILTSSKQQAVGHALGDIRGRAAERGGNLHGLEETVHVLARIGVYAHIVAVVKFIARLPQYQLPEIPADPVQQHVSHWKVEEGIIPEQT